MPNKNITMWILTQWYIYNIPNRVHWNNYSMVKPYSIIIFSYLRQSRQHKSIMYYLPSRLHYWWILTQWYIYNMPNRVHWNHYSMVTTYAMEWCGIDPTLLWSFIKPLFPLFTRAWLLTRKVIPDHVHIVKLGDKLNYNDDPSPTPRNIRAGRIIAQPYCYTARP